MRTWAKACTKCGRVLGPECYTENGSSQLKSRCKECCNEIRRARRRLTSPKRCKHAGKPKRSQSASSLSTWDDWARHARQRCLSATRRASIHEWDVWARAKQIALKYRIHHAEKPQTDRKSFRSHVTISPRSECDTWDKSFVRMRNEAQQLAAFSRREPNDPWRKWLASVSTNDAKRQIYQSHRKSIAGSD